MIREWLLRRRLRRLLREARMHREAIRRWRADRAKEAELRWPKHKNQNVLGNSSGRETHLRAVQNPGPIFKSGKTLWEDVT